MYSSKILPLLILGAFVVTGGVFAGAQAYQKPFVNPFQGVEAEFAGFTPAGEARFNIAVDLVPVSQANLVVHLRDAVQTFQEPQCNCTWVFTGDISQPTRLTFSLTAGSWYMDPVFVDAKVDGRVVSSLGPLQLPLSDSGLTPFGAVDFNRNRLHLGARGDARPGGLIRFDVEGAIPGAASLIALSTGRTRIDFSAGGTLLIQPNDNLVAAPFMADSDGRFSVSFPIPSIPELRGVTFYTQAASETQTDDLVPWFFSNGIQVVLKELVPNTQ